MATDFWKNFQPSEDFTHFLLGEKVVWNTYFIKVLKFHAPGYAPVCDETGWYHIDGNGIPLHPERYQSAWGYYEGRSAVEDSRGFFHLDEHGQAAYPHRFVWVGNFQQGCCVAQTADGSFLHILPDGKPLYPQRYLYVGDFRDGIACVQVEGRGWTHIRKDGTLLHGRYFAGGLGVFHKGFATACDELGWFHLTPNGEPLYPERYVSAEPFYNGKALVRTKSMIYSHIAHPSGE